MGNQRTIHYQTGSENGFDWDLQISIGRTCIDFTGSFIVRNNSQRMRENLRRRDRAWRDDRFYPQWYKQYEIHHEWNNGAVVRFLTPKEHKEADKE